MITASLPNTQNLLKLHLWQKASPFLPRQQRSPLSGRVSPAFCPWVLCRSGPVRRLCREFLFQILELLRPLKRTVPTSLVKEQLLHRGVSVDWGLVTTWDTHCPPQPAPFTQAPWVFCSRQGEGASLSCVLGGWVARAEDGALGLSGLLRGKETRISCKQLGGFLRCPGCRSKDTHLVTAGVFLEH